MHSVERQHLLLTLAREEGRVDVTGTAAKLGVARETVRRDLRELETRGLVRRAHGAARPVEPAGSGTGQARRTDTGVELNRRIATSAATLLGEAETVFVDDGCAPQALASLLPTGRPLTVVTASVATAIAVARSPDLTVLLLGGRVRARTQATAGSWACAMLAGFVIDLAFVGADGISRRLGLTTSDPAAAAVRAKAVQVSRRRIFLGDHSRFGAGSSCRFAEVADLEAIVTDTGLSATEAHRYSLMGPQVLRV